MNPNEDSRACGHTFLQWSERRIFYLIESVGEIHLKILIEFPVLDLYQDTGLVQPFSHTITLR